MPFPGGSADKAGNRYELCWTVRQFIRLLLGESNWIELEPIGQEGERIEFLLSRNDGVVEAHQVKRQQAGKGHWTIADLGRAGVLDGFRLHALGHSRQFVFVSTQATKSLQEITERASVADGPSSFSQSLSQDLSIELTQFQGKLTSGSDQEVWAALRQASWEPIGETHLRDEVLALLSAHISGDASAALGILANYALEAIHQRITSQDLWAVLGQSNIHPSDIARDISLPARLSECQANYLQSQDFGIGDLIIPRKETESAVKAYLNNEESIRSLFLLGRAGTGKSGVTSQIIKSISENGWLVLPFRLDRLEPTQHPDEIGRQLFGRVKSPVAILAGLAGGKDCLIVIEQLDAVSIVSGRSPESFQAVAKLVAEARAHANIRLLLVCRAFDLENDQRLRDLREVERSRSETVHVSTLEPEQVIEAISSLGIDMSQLSEKQIELLRLPLHLALLNAIVQGKGNKTISYTSAKELFDAFWLRKRTDLLPVLSDQNSFEAIQYQLCDEINLRQALSTPRGALPPGDADLNRLVSAHMIQRQGAQIAFFHEAFFDYVFARRFCESGETLFDFLSSGEQDIFHRSQVRQILVFRRQDDFTAYLNDIKSCLESSSIRFHMKKLILEIMSLVADPTIEEWRAIESLVIGQANKLPSTIRSVVWPSVAWFRFLHDRGVLANLLEGNDTETKDAAFSYVGFMGGKEPEKLADLLEELALRSEETDKQILSAITWPSFSASYSERVELIFFKIAENPGRDWTFRIHAFKEFIEHYGFGTAETAPTACRALGRWLQFVCSHNGADLLNADGVEIREVIERHILLHLAEHAPEAYVFAVTPAVLNLLETSKSEEERQPYNDEIWHGGFQGLTHWEPEALIESLANALCRISKSSHGSYLTVLELLRRSNFSTAHAILLRALNPDDRSLVDFAISYLEESWKRWGLWYDARSRWDCRSLLKKFAPFLNLADISRLEPYLLAYLDPWEPLDQEYAAKDKEYARNEAKRFWMWNGYRQYELLSALPIDILSEKLKIRLLELSRKAETCGWKVEEPLSVRGGWVESPLPQTVTSMMTDQQWLSAIKTYSDERERKYFKDKVIGGAAQLSRLLQEKTKSFPERFAQLLLRLPEDTNEHYFNAIVMGLGGAQLPLTLLGRVIDLIHARPNRPHGRWIGGVIVGNCELNLPSEILSILTWYATEDPNPESELWRINAGSGQPNYGGSIHGHGINTVRGSAAHDIARLISQDRSYWEFYAPVIERMVHDPSLAVRSCVIEACVQSLRYDRPWAIAQFLTLCDADDILLAAKPVEMFLYYTVGTEFDQLRPLLDRMLASGNDSAIRKAARQILLAALFEPSLIPHAMSVICGDANMRKSAAQIFCANLAHASEQEFCIGNLIALFSDPDDEVRKAASHWIFHIKKESVLSPYIKLAETYIETPAFSENIDSFFRMLEKAVDAPPCLMFRAGQKLIEFSKSVPRGRQSSFSIAAKQLSNIVLRAYRQAENDPALRRQCLDLFDQLLRTDSYGAKEAIDSIER